MKKHILILVLVLFAFGISELMAQDPVLTPTSLAGCIDIDDPLKPVPGNPYTYQVDVPTPPGTKRYHWYVTQDPNFVASGAYNFGTATPIEGPILAAGSAHYNQLTPNENTISLTWKSFVLDMNEYVFVVIYVENENAECTTNNLKVYRIIPQHAFTLDIANINPGAPPAIAGPDFPVCVDDIQSAVFDASFGTDGGVVYNYGQNTFYYAVAAANFSNGYQLRGLFNGLQPATPAGTQGQVATIYWDYTFAGLAANPNPTVITNGTEFTIGTILAPGGGFVGASGQTIYLKVVIDHNSFEATSEVPYNLAIDGVLVGAGPSYNPLPYPQYADIHHADCQPDAFANDISTQVLKPRPAVNAVAPTPFLPIAP